MKKYILLFLVVLAFSSCENNVEYGQSAFQGRKNDVFWKAKDARAYIEGGKLRIEAYATFDELILNTSSANVGNYILGTTDANNFAKFTTLFDGSSVSYETLPVPGPVYAVELLNGGTVYNNGNAIATSGGSGFGLKLDISVNKQGQVIDGVVSSRGNGYLAGDVVTVAGGNSNCTFSIVNGILSNGEIEITEFDNVNMTVSGKFKFNAVKTNSNNPSGDDLLNYQYGEFYKVPIYPSM